MKLSRGVLVVIILSVLSLAMIVTLFRGSIGRLFSRAMDDLAVDLALNQAFGGAVIFEGSRNIEPIRSGPDSKLYETTVDDVAISLLKRKAYSTRVASLVEEALLNSVGQHSQYIIESIAHSPDKSQVRVLAKKNLNGVQVYFVAGAAKYANVDVLVWSDLSFNDAKDAKSFFRSMVFVSNEYIDDRL